MHEYYSNVSYRNVYVSRSLTEFSRLQTASMKCCCVIDNELVYCVVLSQPSDHYKCLSLIVWTTGPHCRRKPFYVLTTCLHHTFRYCVFSILQLQMRGYILCILIRIVKSMNLFLIFSLFGFIFCCVLFIPHKDGGFLCVCVISSLKYFIFKEILKRRPYC